jgi:hypothetical protein
MSKAYLLVVDSKFTTHSAFIDLENLPDGANSHDVEDFVKQGAGLVGWLKAHVDEAGDFADYIRNGNFKQEVLNFISILASFFENMPPADKEVDLLIGVTPTDVNIIRVTEEFARNSYEDFQKYQTKV